MERLNHAKNALIGLSVADALGGFFEFWRGGLRQHNIKNRKVPDIEWHYTDDTNMALSIYEQLRLHDEIQQDELALSFAKHFDPKRGYGMGAHHLMKRIREGGYWRDLAPNMFRGEGSFGNGGAMRIAPLGAFFADDMDALIKNTKLATEITHAHPEGIAGGIAIAVASAYAVRTRNESKPSIAEFINQVIAHIPDSEVRDNCITASQIPTETPIDEVGLVLGNGRNVAAMDTVPISLWCAVRWFDEFEEGFWQLASLGGDVDTTCAIMGGIIGSRSIESIPTDWIEHRETLPAWAMG